MDVLDERERLLLDAVDSGNLASEDPELQATIKTYRDLETLLDQWSLPAELTEQLDLAPQRLVIDGYKIIKQLGKGGFGLVYLARDLRLNRNVAIKVPNWDRLFTKDHFDRALAEARLTAELRHPGIVSVYDVRVVGDQLAVISEFVDGASLEQSLAEGTVPVGSVPLMIDVADALAHVHEKGIVHGDLKPGNILIDQPGRTRITDFGLGIRDANRVDKGMKGAGTLQYMAPEQLNGSDYLDGRVDIWACGVVLYRLLTGSLPFEGKHRDDAAHAICSREPKPPRQIDPSISPRLEQICLKCLQKNPTERYASATDLWRSLDATRKGPHTWRTATLVSFVGILALAAWLYFRTAPASHAVDPQDARGAVAAQLQVSADNMTVQHFDFARGETTVGRSLGRIGYSSSSTRLDEDVAIEVAFDDPRYFYLIALNPDGTAELCWPPNERLEPQPRTTTICPSENEVYGLTEGTGAQAFILFASASPLPTYGRWREEHGEVPWLSTSEYSGGVWFYDKQSGYRPGLMNNKRVSSRGRKAPESFVAACRFFAEESDSNNVAAVLFPVVDR